MSSIVVTVGDLPYFAVVGQNGGVYVSVEMITVLIGIVTILLAFAGAFGWMVHRMDLLENRLGARIDGLDDKLSARIDKVADELVEVKIAIARVEGPPRHLLPVR